MKYQTTDFFSLWNVTHFLTSLTVNLFSLWPLAKFVPFFVGTLESQNPSLLYVPVTWNKITNMHLHYATLHLNPLFLVGVFVSIQGGWRCQLVSACSTLGQGNCFLSNIDRLIGCHPSTLLPFFLNLSRDQSPSFSRYSSCLFSLPHAIWHIVFIFPYLFISPQLIAFQSWELLVTLASLLSFKKEAFPVSKCACSCVDTKLKENNMNTKRYALRKYPCFALSHA